MEYLESKKLIHRDLAARNILLTTPDNVKICDFGMARSIKNQGDGLYKMNETHKIPCAWYAPESIRHKLFSVKSDVWAFGVTLWEVFSLCEQPWPHLSAAEILNKLEFESKRLSQPYLCSRSFYRVILSCWEYTPAERASFSTLKEQIKATKIVDMIGDRSWRFDNHLGRMCVELLVEGTE
jgi:serine/threonine protein kinase